MTITRVKQFYDFMIERELIRQRRASGLPQSLWTNDPIFKLFSFTNVKRHDDRTTIEFKRIYDQHQDASDRIKLLNCALYRFFGTVHSAKVMGWVEDWEHGRDHVYRLGPGLSFTAAYIVTSAGRSDAKYSVVCEFIDSLWSRIDKILEYHTWEGAIREMTECYGFGSFMAKEVYLDFVLATGRLPTDWSTWTPVGPGGKRGAARVRYGINTQIGESEALDVIREIYSVRDEHWPDEIAESDRLDPGQDLTYHLPKLDLTDVQFQLCEFDKYSRVAEGRRPKRLFHPTRDSITERGA